MKYNELINELLDLLDQNNDIIRIKSLKKKILQDSNLINDIENYRLLKTISSKKKLFENKDYLEYLNCENNVNFLIHEIKSKFNFSDRKCHHESN